MIRSDSDLDLIQRFRHLTGKRPLGGFSQSINSNFDAFAWEHLRFHFERHDTIDGWGLGEGYLLGSSSQSVGTWLQDEDKQPPAPMWWDQEVDPDMNVIEDRSHPSTRFYYPQSWPGVFPESPREKAVRLKREREERELKKEAKRKKREAEREATAAFTEPETPPPPPPLLTRERETAPDFARKAEKALARMTEPEFSVPSWVANTTAKPMTATSLKRYMLWLNECKGYHLNYDQWWVSFPQE